MTPPLLIELGLKAFRHPRFRIIGARVAPWTGSGAPAGAGVLAFEGSVRVGFTNPAAVFANCRSRHEYWSCGLTVTECLKSAGNSALAPASCNGFSRMPGKTA